MPAARKGRLPPGGSPVSKPWAAALRICADEPTPDGRRKLRVLADRTFNLAMEGNMEAVREIANRMDGKAVEHHEHDIAGGMTLTMELLAAIKARTNAP